ncbi:hypothetical protein FPZ24_00255 [Sphingomonas panacisoli]|uniref:Glycosyltransferase RgtA/B/C/D-like domain-containing protein n=1 Tax=Sphingomonas panacisoli TaxID=1813879 RepID=A0A5B8LEB7_9SPHN|nr:hypothetical protein [Sphingomonas panacisoli]QDZ06094.1 hypothetical protein FPZ24_00255 [Sphingomonas panacisoli]
MDGDSTKPAWWQTRWFVLAAACLAAAPLLWPDIPPLVDLLGHMGRYRVQIDHGQHPWLAEWYGFRWSLIGNLGVDLLVEWLAPLLGIELTVKLVVVAIPALTAVGLLWIAREVHGRVPPTALFALVLVYNYPFQFGFVNFSLSMALALNAFALWLHLARRGAWALRAVLFVPLSCLLWLCHVFGWGVLGILVFSAELIRARDTDRSWPAAFVRAGVQCLPLALPCVMMVMWRGSGVAGETGDWFNLRAKLMWLSGILRDHWLWFDVACAAVLVAMLYDGLRSPFLGWSRSLGLAAGLLAATFLLLPRILLGSAYADMRLAPYMVAIALIALRPTAAMPWRAQQWRALAALALFAVRMGGTTYSYYLFDRSYDRELAALDHVPTGARLVTFVGTECSNSWTLDRRDHLPGIALERRLAYSNDQWSMAGAQLLTTRYVKAGAFIADPSQIVTSARCPSEWSRSIDRSLATLPRDAFDYVWLIGPPPFDQRLLAGMTPVWRDGTSTLLRIERPPPAGK